MTMDLNFLDPILKFIPSIRKPGAPLSMKEKLKWTGLIMLVYFMMFSTPALGVSISAINQPIMQLISIIFAARIGSLITVGITPIVLSSILLQLIVGTGLFTIDMNNPEQKSRFQGLQKLLAIVIAIAESYIFVSTGYVQMAGAAYFVPVFLQLALCAVFIIFLDEAMTKYGITSGINLFIAGGVAYSIVAGTATILFAEAAASIAAGGATAIPNAILAFGPLFFAIIVFLMSIYAYDIKIELPLVFSQLRGVGGRLPIPFLYVSVLPVILATSLESSLSVWLRVIAGVTGPLAGLAKFFAFYQGTGSSMNLVGGLVYLISPSFPMPYSATYGGVGGYVAYFTYLASHTSNLYLPWGGMVLVPEAVHILIYTLVLVVLAVVFGKFWIEMTGQSPKKVAEQLGDVGWQIPGFRRDPRIVENVLNKYIPTITVLGSIFVALLAALATLSGAVGTGMGILLTVGIMYTVYQQLEQEHALEAYPALNKLLS
ncbi:Protein translocase subunit SecY [uncultured archaeon]|nr:Protein translocase subunit SecY [uncultured archaeon]